MILFVTAGILEGWALGINIAEELVVELHALHQLVVSSLHLVEDGIDLVLRGGSFLLVEHTLQSVYVRSIVVLALDLLFPASGVEVGENLVVVVSASVEDELEEAPASPVVANGVVSGDADFNILVFCVVEEQVGDELRLLAGVDPATTRTTLVHVARADGGQVSTLVAEGEHRYHVGTCPAFHVQAIDTLREVLDGVVDAVATIVPELTDVVGARANSSSAAAGVEHRPSVRIALVGLRVGDVLSGDISRVVTAGPVGHFVLQSKNHVLNLFLCGILVGNESLGSRCVDSHASFLDLVDNINEVALSGIDLIVGSQNELELTSLGMVSIDDVAVETIRQTFEVVLSPR